MSQGRYNVRRHGKKQLYERTPCHLKKRYRDRQEAERALRNIMARSTRDRVPRRVYECDLCNGCHLTSRRDVLEWE